MKFMRESKKVVATKQGRKVDSGLETTVSLSLEKKPSIEIGDLMVERYDVLISDHTEGENFTRLSNITFNRQDLIKLRNEIDNLLTL